MRVVFWWATVCLSFFIISYSISYRNDKKNKTGDDNEESSMIQDNSMRENISNFMRLEINRRLAQSSSIL